MSLVNTTSKKAGIILGYVQLVLQTLSTIFLTSFFIRKLGNENYGVYQMVYSIANYILILDLGISSTMVRFISEYRQKNETNKIENFSAHMLIVVLILAIAAIIFGVIFYFLFSYIYPSIGGDLLVQSKQTFIVLILQILMTIMSHYFQGLALSKERFSFVKIISILQIIIALVSSIVLVTVKNSFTMIANANTIAIGACLVLIIIYDFVFIKQRIRWHGFDKKMMMPALALMFAMLLNSIIAYINTSLDKMILGRMATPNDVTVYAVAATLISFYNAIPTTISSVFLPEVTRAVYRGDSEEELTNIVIRVGRVQLYVCLAIIGGFVLFGRQFISYWTGGETIDAWQYALFIMVPNTIPLIQNICLSILDAKNKRMFRSIILIGISAFNIGLTILFVFLWGPIGAPISTGICFFLGYGIALNWYYKKKIGLNVKRMFMGIFKRTWLVFLIVFIYCAPLAFVLKDSIYEMAIGLVIYILVFICFNWKFALNRYEKGLVKSLFNRFSRK